MKLSQLEHDIKELEDKKKIKDGLTPAERKRLEQLQDEWYAQESKKYGQCRNCFI